MYNFLSKLKQIGLQRNDSVSVESCNTDSTLNCTIESQGDEDDDDDYLLVCVPAKKANIESVSHSQTVVNQKSLQNGDCSTVSDSSECQRNELLLQSPSSAVLDVPFSLHPVLVSHMQARAMFDHINLEPGAFNYSKYSHDFVREKLCLRDMNSDEMANIDEFLIPPGDAQSSTHIPLENSEVNLIQL